MSSSWTNTSLLFQRLPKGDAPLRNLASAWPNAEGNAFYLYGGETSFWLAWPGLEKPSPASLWKFIQDDSVGGTWSHDSVAEDASIFSDQPSGGLRTSGEGVGYYLGGSLGFTTYPQQPYGTVIPLTGLIEFNSSTRSWSNLSSTEIYNAGPSRSTGQAAYGGAHFVPNFGAEGLVVFFGVRPPELNVGGNVTYFGSMTDVSIFDPFSRTWFKQTASGPSIPDWRANFCTTGVMGEDGTYEMSVSPFLKKRVHREANIVPVSSMAGRNT